MLPNFSLESSKERLTCHSGLILFGEFCKRLGLSRLCEAKLPCPGSNRGFSAFTHVHSVIMMLHGGGRHLEDLRILSRDAVLQDVLNIKVPSADSCGDWLRRMGEKDHFFLGMESINQQLLNRLFTQEPRSELTLDIDATVIAANKASALTTYKECKGYTPIVGHIAEYGFIINDWFRHGNVPPASANLEFIQSCVEQLPKGVHFTGLRADAASYQHKILNYCEDRQIDYAIGGRICDSLRQTIQAIPSSQWNRLHDKEGVDTGSDIAAIPYELEKANHCSTMIVTRRPLKQRDLFHPDGYRYHLVITNKVDEPPEEVLYWYNQRGEHSENRLKELKLGFAMEYMPCGTFEANAAFFKLGTIAYNLFVLFKRLTLDKQWHHRQIQTIRLHIYQWPAKLIKTARTSILKVMEQSLMMLQAIRYRAKTATA